MMKTRDDTVYLRHILDSIERVERYVEDLTERDFLDDELRQDAVIRQLSIIGEAVKQLSDKVRDEYPSVPWKDIAGMRDKLIHDYLGVDLEAVWDTVTRDLKPLKHVVQNILE
jgi:uncharacterized protein with HEPN domain